LIRRTAIRILPPVAELLALVDLGSNATRFTLASIVPGRQFRVLREERVQTRLGDGPMRLLARDAVAKTVWATQRFLASVSRPHRPRVLAVATAAVRDARNAERLLGALRARVGVEVEVLSGEDEARLGAVAALASLPVGEGVVLDIGGGSAQLTRVHRRTLDPLASVPLGAVRLTRGLVRHDPPWPAELHAVRCEVRRHLDGVLPAAAGSGGLVGQGGTIRTLARMHLAATPRRRRTTVHGLRVDRDSIGGLRQAVSALPLRRRRRLAGLKAERADVIVAGAVVLEEIMVLGGYATLTVCGRGVRHGLLIRETFGLERLA
jgi:exopolyphosphatase / guanosine-5'-triphosphate,3'-diphosphate pyrophosphatase